VGVVTRICSRAARWRTAAGSTTTRFVRLGTRSGRGRIFFYGGIYSVGPTRLYKCLHLGKNFECSK
jgi:hypothetical protein